MNNSDLLNKNKEALYLKTDFYNEHFITQTTPLCSKTIKNFNKSLWNIVKSKLLLDPHSLDKINVYSCMIPELFSRRLRTSKVCQLTGKAVFDSMQKAITFSSALPELKILKDLREGVMKLERSDLMDYSFRIEFTTNLFAESVNFRKYT